MKIKIDVERCLAAQVTAPQLQSVLEDIEAALKKFPKLRKLTMLDEQSYRLDMQTIGSSIAKIAHDASFGARFSVGENKGELRWVPVAKVGNASLEGFLRLEGKAMKLRVWGELHDVPVPLMYRLVAPAFIQGKFSALADTWLERIAAMASPKSSRAAI